MQFRAEGGKCDIPTVESVRNSDDALPLRQISSVSHVARVKFAGTISSTYAGGSREIFEPLTRAGGSREIFEPLTCAGGSREISF